MNGEEVLDTRFMSGAWGYDVREVDELLRRVAAELDTGRSVGPLIENVTFRRPWFWRGGYDVDAVGWFLNQLLSPLDDSGLAEVSTDPWRELAVAQWGNPKLWNVRPAHGPQQTHRDRLDPLTVREEQSGSVMPFPSCVATS